MEKYKSMVNISYSFLIVAFAYFSLSVCAFGAETSPDAYTTIGLGGLDPKDKSIVTYVPGLTLLYVLGDDTVPVRKHNDPTKRRPYKQAITQDGIKLLILDEDDSIERDVSTLRKFQFLVNRALPACKRLDVCIAHNIWEKFDAGKRGGSGWYTIWARQGGKFMSHSPSPDDQFWEVKILDNIDGWVTRYIPAKKNNRSIEDLGYITRLDRPHPLFCFSEVEGVHLNTDCNETVKELTAKDILAEIKVFGKLGAEVTAEPKIPLPFGKHILKFLGVDAEIKAEASIEGDAAFSYSRNSEAVVSYGAQGQCWESKSVRIGRVSDDSITSSPNYVHYGNMLIKKIYDCEGDVKAKLRNVNITIYLGDIGSPVDFKDPLPPLNLNQEVIKVVVGLKPNPEYPALTSITGQNDYDKLMSYFLLKKGLPRSIATFIIREINLSPPLD